MTTSTQDPPRTSYLGGHDIAAICGKSEWRTPLDVYLEKAGIALPQPRNERMELGLDVEPAILNVYRRRNKVEVVSAGFRQDPDEPWRGGHADGIALYESGKRKVLVSAKFTAAHQREQWRKAVPIDYVYQEQHYLLLHDANEVDWAVMFGNLCIEQFHAEADPILQHEIQVTARDFWNDCVLPKKPPSGPSVEHAGRTMGVREATVSEIKWLSELAIARRLKSKAEDRDESVLAQLKETAKDIALTVNGVVVFEWKPWERKSYTVQAASGIRPALPAYPSLAKKLGLCLDGLDVESEFPVL